MHPIFAPHRHCCTHTPWVKSSVFPSLHDHNRRHSAGNSNTVPCPEARKACAPGTGSRGAVCPVCCLNDGLRSVRWAPARVVCAGDRHKTDHLHHSQVCTVGPISIFTLTIQMTSLGRTQIGGVGLGWVVRELFTNDHNLYLLVISE